MRFWLHNSCQPTDRGRGPQFSYRRSYLCGWHCDETGSSHCNDMSWNCFRWFLDINLFLLQNKGKHEDSWQGMATFWHLVTECWHPLWSDLTQVSGLNIPAAEQRVSGLVMLSLHTWHLTAPSHNQTLDTGWLVWKTLWSPAGGGESCPALPTPNTGDYPWIGPSFELFW